jgi:hypothetical protein
LAHGFLGIRVPENQGRYKIASSGAMVCDKQLIVQETSLAMEMFGVWGDCRAGHFGGSAIDGSGLLMV